MKMAAAAAAAGGAVAYYFLHGRGGGGGGGGKGGGGSDEEVSNYFNKNSSQNEEEDVRELKVKDASADAQENSASLGSPARDVAGQTNEARQSVETKDVGFSGSRKQQELPPDCPCRQAANDNQQQVDTPSPSPSPGPQTQETGKKSLPKLSDTSAQLETSGSSGNSSPSSKENDGSRADETTNVDKLSQSRGDRPSVVQSVKNAMSNKMPDFTHWHGIRDFKDPSPIDRRGMAVFPDDDDD